jgi:hypothetical protein
MVYKIFFINYRHLILVVQIKFGNKDNPFEN